jgi:hypothetical protein
VKLRWLFGASWFALILLRGQVAHAGCGSVCEGTVGEVTLDPPLECATLEPSLDTCGCAVRLAITNGCAGALELDNGQTDCEKSSACGSVPAGAMASFKIWIHEKGDQKWTLSLREATSGDHVLSASANVTELDDELGPCALVRLGGPARGAAHLAWFLGAALLLRRFGSRARRG